MGVRESRLGAALGGWFAFRAGRRAALLACGLLQTASLACYVAAAFGIGGIAIFWAGTVAEHLLGGMATVALFTLMMDASDPEHAGAAIADSFGYASAFVAGLLLSGAGCLVLVTALDARRGPARLEPVWTSNG